MKEVPFQIEQQNIFEMLTGNQFYENVDAYLREALLNAIDSCCMRQVLQYSWGAEFMERERDERDEKNLFVHHTKPLYVPKIRILLDEKTKTLTIDDNGMGMDIHDFYSYVIPIGKSYYRSEDFKIHRLDYEPLGNFGIGMQSYFKAATEIIIDSKKDKSVSTAWNVVDENRLKQTLGDTTIDTVNEVGVWLNTASASLLKYVSGLNERSAKAIVAYRDEHGSFKERKDLLKVKGFGQKTFLDAAGFLRVENENPLERSAVHPKDYEATYALLKKLGVSLSDLGTEKANTKLNYPMDIPSLSKELGVGEYTLKDIIEELKKPGRDPREKAMSAELDNKVKDIKDLQVGMIINGTVRNLSDFGAFVDIGVHQDGLVHISEIADHFIKHPSDELELGQIVKVKVIGIDIPRKRISLSIKQVA